MNTRQEVGARAGEAAFEPVRQRSDAPPQAFGPRGKLLGVGGPQRRREEGRLAVLDTCPHTSLNVACGRCWLALSVRMNRPLLQP
jgi:hypothetical protein